MYNAPGAGSSASVTLCPAVPPLSCAVHFLRTRLDQCLEREPSQSTDRETLCGDQTAASFDDHFSEGGGLRSELSMEYTITAAFLLVVVTGRFAAAVLGGCS
jgi:hypothetical protein